MPDETQRPITVYTIGFTHKSAEAFFTRLKTAGVRRVVDIRLRNDSQLAGFSKKQDLEYFLRELAGIDYIHRPELAPTSDILDKYKKNRGDWSVYQAEFLDLMSSRRIEESLEPVQFDRACLLCSEPTPDRCHRRLVADYLQAKWGSLEVVHL